MTMSELLGKYVSKLFVNPVVECVDVDGVVRRMNVDEALDRIDINHLLDRINVDKLLDRVDWNQHIDKIDLQAVLEKVDVEDLVARSNVGAVVMQSTTGVFTQVLDNVRSRLIMIDLCWLRMSRLRWRDAEGILPRIPGRNPPRPSSFRRDRAAVEHADTDDHRDNNDNRIHRRRRYHYPSGRYSKSIAVQGCYCGFFSKAVAVIFDVAFLTTVYAGVIVLLKGCLILFSYSTSAEARDKVSRDKYWVIVLYCCFWALHFFLGITLTGQTVGMALAGLQCVDHKTGQEPELWQALLRTALLPITLTVCPPLGIVGAIRHDGRMLHDLIAGTGLVYNWDAHMAKIRVHAQERMRWQQKQQRSSSFFLSDDDDEDAIPSPERPLLQGSESSHASYESVAPDGD